MINDKMAEVKSKIENLYNTISINGLIESKKYLVQAFEELEEEIKVLQEPVIKCTATVCKNNKNGMCVAESIEIVDSEENENIKFKENDYMVCKSFKGEC